MKELDKNLIAAAAQNDFKSVKRFAKQKLLDDKAQKDIRFCKEMIQKLEQEEMKQLEIPNHLKGMISVENVEETFQVNRYFLSKREQELSDDIFKINRATQKLFESGIRFVNSTIVYGESGTGKTTYGRYLAYKLGLPFVYITFSRLMDSLLGKTQQNLNKIFDYVKERNCVFMIDEIDAIARKRGSTGEIGEMSRIVISLMQNLDELHNGVILLGATNRIDEIDEAVLRRFSIKHEICRLNEDERKAMVLKFLDDIENYFLPNAEISEIVKSATTQSDLMNRIILKMVNDFSMEDEGQLELFE